MQPFSRRSSLPQDYESVPPPRPSARPPSHQPAQHYGQAPVSAIGAPRPRPAPVFHRQAPPPPAYSAYSNDPYSSPYSHAPQSVAPPAPHSLAPVEMNAYAGQPRNYQTDRGVAHTSTTNIKPRPTWRTGAMILLAGVFVGGTFGIGVQARRNAMDEQAAMANAATNVAPPAQATQALPPVQQQQAVAPGPTALQPTPPQAPPQAYAQAPANAGLPPGAIVIPPQQGVVVVPPTQPQQPAMASAQQQPAQQPQAHAPAAKKTVAWRAPAPPPATRPAPAPAAEPKEPKQPSAQIAAKVTAPKKEAQEPADPPEPPVKKGGKKGATDAQSVLQDALRETTNTL